MRIELSAPKQKLKAMVTSKLSVTMRSVYSTAPRLVANANKYFLPYMSPRRGTQSKVAAQPRKKADGIRLGFQ